jgi:hypothetical protein
VSDETHDQPPEPRQPPVVVLRTSETEALVAIGMLRANGVDAWMGNAADAGEVMGLPLGPGAVVVPSGQADTARALLADVNASEPLAEGDAQQD